MFSAFQYIENGDIHNLEGLAQGRTVHVTDEDWRSMDEEGYTPLMRAVRSQHGADAEVRKKSIAMVRILLQHPGPRSSIDHQSDAHDGKTALLLSLDGNEFEIVELLVKHRTPSTLRIADKYGNTPLLSAVYRLRPDYVELLLMEGAVSTLDMRNVMGITALMMAAGNEYLGYWNETQRKGAVQSNLRILDMLLTAGSPGVLEAIDNRGRTAVMHAVMENNLPELVRLLQSGGDRTLHVQDQFGRTALMKAVKNQEEDMYDSAHEYQMALLRTKAICDVLLKHGGDKTLHLQDAEGRTALMEAVKNVETTRSLLHSGAASTIHLRDEDGDTALMKAITVSRVTPAILLELPETQAIAATANRMGQTPLMYAVDNYDIDLAKLLLPFGGVDAKDHQGHSALSVCMNGMQVDMAKLLIEAGADYETQHPETRMTPLYMAVDVNDKDMVTWILDLHRQHPDKECLCLNAQTSEGATALMRAVSNRHLEIARILLDTEARAGIDLFETGGKTALVLAVLRDGMDMVRLLLDKGASTERPHGYDGPEAMSPMMAAAQRGDLDMMNLFAEINPTSIQEQNIKGHTALTYAVGSLKTEAVRWMLERPDTGMLSILKALCVWNRFVSESHDATMGNEEHEEEDGGVFPFPVVDMQEEQDQVFAIEDAEDQVLPMDAHQDQDNDSLYDDVQSDHVVIDPDAVTTITLLLWAKWDDLVDKATPEDLCLSNEIGETVLMMLCALGDERRVEKVLDNGAEACINEVDQAERTALFHAIIANHIKVVEILLDRGASVGTQYEGWTSLMIAISEDRHEIVDLLLHSQQDLDINAQNEDGNTALLMAVYRDNYDLVETLLGMGASETVHLQNKYGRTALIYAVIDKNAAAVDLMLRNGAYKSINAHDALGITSLQAALGPPDPNHEILHLLLKYGAAVDKEDEDRLYEFGIIDIAREEQG